jgi:predicted ATPase/class 3 adenylate cyclase
LVQSFQEVSVERSSETVSFLFTDIEGSSRLWDEQPAEMSRLLAIHDGIIRSMVGEHDGEVFATGGDSFAVAFASPDSAVRAAVAAQRRLGEDLGDVLRVRMAIHSGKVEEREGGFFGPVLNRCARLRDTAHGGQILLTQGVHDRVDSGQLAGVAFVDLGEHRLRDLSAPERVFQIDAESLPSEFPPIRSLGAFIHNLPMQLTTFVGRSEEINLVDKLLADTRHTTLVGPGGSGKTRLALQVAADSIHHYPDGAWFVDFRDLDDPDQVGNLIASTLRVVLAGDRPVADQVVAALWARKLLLILDNCEHLLEAVAPLVEQFLCREGAIRVLATSREQLGLPGESNVVVGPLPLPTEPNFGQLADFEAVQLFVDRAQKARPGFALDQHVDAAFEICRAVDGLPLALELAAARLRVVSPDELADRLDDQLGMLRTTQKAGDLRHATIEATIAWSWNLLSPAEQSLFARLSVFPGTWSLGAAETICGSEPIDPNQVLDLLAALVDKSLVVPEPIGDGPTRYRLLEPLRQYAASQLEAKAATLLQYRLIDHWSARFAEAVIDVPIGGQRTRQDIEDAKAVEPDRASLVSAVEWALSAGRYEDAMTIFGGPFGDLLYMQGGYFETATRWIDTALEHRRSLPAHVLTAALWAAASIAATAWRNEAWLKYATVGMEIARTTRGREAFAVAAAVAMSRAGERERAFALFDQITAESDDPSMQASALLGKATEESAQQAWELCRQATELSPLDSLGFWDEEGATWIVGLCARDAGHYDLGSEMLKRALDLAQDSVASVGIAAHLADIHIARGHLDEASTIINEALASARRSFGPDGSAHMIERGLLRAVEIARFRGDYRSALEFLSELQQLELSVGDTWRVGQEALLARDRGELDHARKLLADASRRAEAGDDFFAGIELIFLSGWQAGIDLRVGRPDRACENLKYVLTQYDSLTHSQAVDAVDLTAIAFARLGRAEEAACLMGAVDRQREGTGLVIQPPDQALRTAAVDQVRTMLGDGWEAGYQQGHNMNLDEAVDYAGGHVKEAVPDSRHSDAS